MTILWRGKIGYGDVVSPICYAANRRESLVFGWPHGPQEWAVAAAKHVAARHETPVDVRHVHDVEFHFDHTNYDDRDPLHNVGFIGLERCPEEGLFARVTTARNAAPLPAGKAWKSPAADWRSLDTLRTVDVDYRTPIGEAVDVLLRAELCIGYHGSASWLARWCGCPQVVVSADPGGITTRSFAQAVVVSDVPAVADLPALRNRAQARLDKVKNGVVPP